MARKLSLGGSTANVDPFKAPMNAYQKEKRVAKKAAKEGEVATYMMAQYWMREYELQIEALGGVLLAAARPPRMTPAIKARMEAAEKELTARAKERQKIGLEL